MHIALDKGATENMFCVGPEGWPRHARSESSLRVSDTLRIFLSSKVRKFLGRPASMLAWVRTIRVLIRVPGCWYKNKIGYLYYIAVVSEWAQTSADKAPGSGYDVHF